MTEQTESLEHRDEADFLDLLSFLGRHSRWFVIPAILGAVLGLGFSYLVKPRFTARAQLVNPERSVSAKDALVGRLGEGLVPFFGPGSERRFFLRMFQSDALRQAIVDKFDLVKRYGAANSESACAALAERLTADMQDDIITISIEDADPELAAQLCNAFILELDHLNTRLSVTTAKRKRMFLENCLARVKRQLSQAEIEFRDFKRRTGVVSIRDQAASAVSIASKLMTDILLAEVQLGVEQLTERPDHPRSISLATKLERLRKQLDGLEGAVGVAPVATEPAKSSEGKEASAADHRRSYGELRLVEIPDLELQFTRLGREVAIDETLLQYLTKEYEAARIQEDSETTYISVLNHASVPSHKSSPKRLNFLMLGMFLGLFAGALLSVVREICQRLKSDNPLRLAQLQKDLGRLAWILRLG